MARVKPTKQKTNNGANVGYEAELWQMADALRGSMDAAEYKHVVLGLIFLKYISDAFEEQHAKLEAEKPQGADPEDPDEYRALNIFWVPPEARWSHLKAQAKQPTIGQLVDDAMAGIERDNPSLKGVLPKDYARPALDKQRLGQIIDLIANIKVGDSESRSKDVLGQVYQYFLKQFALAEGRKGGEFWTPQSVVQLLVEMLEPYKGRVYDPCSGTGGMFVQSVRFIDAHAKGNGNGGRAKGAISIYGQESNYTTWRLARMNLAIRGIDAQIAHGDTFHNDHHPDLRADFILANPHFNDSDWRGELLRDDKRWQFGKPPASNANFAWVQHIIHHLAPMGLAGFVLANGSMSSNQSGEGEIRKSIIEADLVDCMIALPGQLFYSTQIPACLWFICRDKSGKPSPGAWRHPLPEGEGHYRGGFDFSGLVNRAREMRKNPTKAEEIVWDILRDQRFLNLKFRRQHQVGDYVVDFYCHEKRLVVELDGPVHSAHERVKIDQKRDGYLRSQGLKVVRFRNEDVLNNTDSVLQQLAVVATESSPSGRGEEVRVNRFRDRRGETLFIDTRKLGVMADRTHRELTDDEIARVTRTYHAWRGSSLTSSPSTGEDRDGGDYKDIPGFCKSATLDEIRKHGHVLTPGRYVGAEAQEDDGEPFEEKMKRLTTTLSEQQAEAAKLDAAIAANLKGLGYGG